MHNLPDRALTLAFEVAALVPAVLAGAFIVLGPSATMGVALYSRFGGHHG